MSKELKGLLDQPRIGVFIKASGQIDDLPNYWMDFEDDEKFKIFVETIETDQTFVPLVQYLKQIKCVNLDDGQQVEKIRSLTTPYEMLNKYVALIYVSSKYGVTDQADFVRYFGSPRKTGKISFPSLSYYRWVQEVDDFISLFNLQEMMYSWDGETALLDPLSKATGSGPIDCPWTSRYCWHPKWVRIADSYLVEKKVIKESINDLKEKMSEYVKKDKALAKVLKTLEINEQQLKTFFNVQDPFEYAEEIGRAVPDHVVATKAGSDYVCFLRDFGGASDERGWDIRISRSILILISGGKVFFKKLPYYFVYEDFPGGQTYRYPEKELRELERVSKRSDGWTVKCLNSEKNVVNVELKEYVFLGNEQKIASQVERFIADHKVEWLSHGNLNMIPLAFSQGQDMGNYPYEIVWQKALQQQEKIYIGVVKVIDAERCDNSNGISPVLIDSQLKVSIHEVNLKDSKYQEIFSETLDRNESFYCFLDVGVAEQDQGNYLFMTMVPEIIQSAVEIGVVVKLRKGESDWKTFEFKTKK